MTKGVEPDSDSKKRDGRTSGETCVLSDAVKNEPAAQHIPARAPAGHGEQPLLALPESLLGQQCAAGLGIEAAPKVRMGACRPTTSTTRSAMKRRLIT